MKILLNYDGHESSPKKLGILGSNGQNIISNASCSELNANTFSPAGYQ